MKNSKWSIDRSHSEIQFRVRHMMISTVTGQFNNFDSSFEMEGEDITTAKIAFTADVTSISTNNDQRDAHLRATDFFDSENHPKLSFVSEKIDRIEDDEFKLHGSLTMRGISRKVTFDVNLGGITLDPWGNTRAGFSISGKVNRRDFGINFSMISETGGILLSDEVKISVNAEFVKEAVKQAA